jgi:hypothetical protein
MFSKNRGLVTETPVDLIALAENQERTGKYLKLGAFPVAAVSGVAASIMSKNNVLGFDDNLNHFDDPQKFLMIIPSLTMGLTGLVKEASAKRLRSLAEDQN